MRIDLEFCRRMERAEADGLRSAVEHGKTAFPHQGLAAETLAGGTLAFAGADSPLSQASGVGIGSDVCDTDVDRMVDFYHSRGAPARVVASPAAGEALVRKLARRGFAPEEYENVLVAELAYVDAARDSRVAVSTDPDVWADRSGRAFADGEAPSAAMRFVGILIASHPRVMALALTAHGEIVTTGCLALEDDGVSALFATSTAPQARGRGFQTAMIGDRLARAKEAGCSIARATANPAGTSERNFRRFGFTPLYTRCTWLLQP